MKQTTKRFASMAIVAALLIAAFVVYSNLIGPAYQDALKVKSDVISRQNFVQNQQEAVKNVKQLISDYASQTSMQDAVSAVLPERPSAAEALAALNNMISQSGLQASSFSIGSGSGAGGAPAGAPSFGYGAPPVATLVRPVGVMTLQGDAVGPYEAVKIFLGELDDSLRIFDVQNLSLTPQDKPTVDSYHLHFSASVYYQTAPNASQ
ncbi:MAG: hypothetical protein KGI73_04730 [Patescibacteria group bacterium]|nr:hypothetical protein [Patescibacteria group bacterium]